MSLEEKCIEYGAHKAFIIDVDQIPFDRGLREYCVANYCGHYGKNHACPPDVGDADALIAEAKKYSKALLFQTVNTLEDSYDFEGMEAAKVMHAAVADKINEDVKLQYADYLQLTVGSCEVCSKCSKLDDQPCRFPDKMVSSLEAYCMNVSTLAELCEMKYINGVNTVTYFGAFLFNHE